MEGFGSWLAANLVALTATLAAAGSVWKWLADRAAERSDKREKGYWELLDISLGRDDKETTFKLRQVAALLMLLRYGEYKDITEAVLRDALAHPNSAWTVQHKELISTILARL